MTIQELCDWAKENNAMSYNLITFGVDTDTIWHIDIRDLNIDNEKKEVSIE